MKNARSTTKEKSVNTFHYAVHPIAAQFDKQSTKNYYLYLQKNQQILGRYELCPKTIGKSTRFYFQIPSAVQYFRIISESNLEFRWSLYMEKISDNYRQQEYMQGKKANLKWCWQNYEVHQENVHWIQAIFGVVKLKFYYLFVVGQNHQSILQSIQDYYKKNTIKPTKIYQNNTTVQSLENQEGKANSLQKIAQLSYKISQTIPFLLQSQSYTEEMKSGDRDNNKSTPAKQISNINNFQDKAIQNNLVSSFIQGEGNKQETVLKSLDQLKLKLTVSELQISKDIQRKIIESQQEASKVVQQENIQILSKHKTRPMVSANSLERTRQITSSQYLNQRNQMVVSPFYSHIKYWIIIIAILIIFGTLVHLGPKKRIVQINHDEPAHHNQHVPHKSKKSKATKKHDKKKQKPKSERERKKSTKKNNKRK